MALSQEMISDNGISPVALAFFSALFTMVSTVMLALFKDRKETREAKQASIQAAESAETAVTNTQSFGNGFARNVLGQLGTINTKIDVRGKQIADINRKVDQLSETLQHHMQWHLDNQRKEPQ